MIGFLTTFIFYIALLYAITSLDDVLNSPIIELPLAAIYLQATNSRAGATGLLIIFLINLLVTIPGAYVTCGRMLWTLARDDATPFSRIVGRVSPTQELADHCHGDSRPDCPILEALAGDPHSGCH